MKQRQEVQSLLKQMAKGCPALAEEVRTWVRTLIDRKKTLFGHDRRMVMSHTFVNEGGRRELYVVSALIPER